MGVSDSFYQVTYAGVPASGGYRIREVVGVVDEIEMINAELEETIISVLGEAGRYLRPNDAGHSVENGSFEADEHDVGRRLVDLDLNRIRSEQESIVIKDVADGLSPVEWGTLETLVTDGGEVSPADIADEQGFHPGSVRRALDGIDDLVEHEYSQVTLRSQHIAELVHEAVQEAKEASREAVEAGARKVEAAERGVDETTSAMMAFCAKHGIAGHDRRDAQLKLRRKTSRTSGCDCGKPIGCGSTRARTPPGSWKRVSILVKAAFPWPGATSRTGSAGPR